jgi:ubiquinone/menaquinone biosynthesis C-methylase UbiE
MTDHFKHIYANEAQRYDAMVGREDQRGNLFAVLNEIVTLDGNQRIVEFGAGTGRMTRLLLFQSAHIMALDMSPAMLAQAQESLSMTGMPNWSLAVGDNGRMPIASNSADIVIEGWSFAHAVGWYPDTWRTQIDAMLAEMQRIVRPGGTAILLETMGTGNRQPTPPNEGLAELYAYWQEQHGFAYRWTRTDYQFESLQEGDELTRFFFGDELADQFLAQKSLILPECTGIWWRTY